MWDNGTYLFGKLEMNNISNVFSVTTDYIHRNQYFYCYVAY